MNRTTIGSPTRGSLKTSVDRSFFKEKAPLALRKLPKEEANGDLRCTGKVGLYDQKYT